MRFPLPPDIFPRVSLDTDERQELAELATLIVQDALQQRQELYESSHGRVDRRQWKKLKHHADVTVYKQRQGGCESSHFRTRSSSSEPPALMTVGSIVAQLDDIMYGVSSTSFDAMRIKSSYVGDQIVDCSVLATILGPSRDDPFRSQQLKWAVKAPSAFVRHFVRARDYVYLESTGTIVAATGERIGYQLLHSVQVPGIRELRDLDIVRGQMSHCSLYRQQDEHTVEVFATSTVNPLGKLKPWHAASAFAMSLASVSRLVHCAEMKKLTWLLKTSSHALPLCEEQTQGCVVCKKVVDHSLHGRKSCQSCLESVCAHCRESKRLSFISCRSDKVVQHDLVLCKLCIMTATETDADAIARYENSHYDKHFADTNILDLAATMSPTVSDGGLLSVTEDFDRSSFSSASSRNSVEKLLQGRANSYMRDFMLTKASYPPWMH